MWTQSQFSSDLSFFSPSWRNQYLEMLSLSLSLSLSTHIHTHSLWNKWQWWKWRRQFYWAGLNVHHVDPLGPRYLALFDERKLPLPLVLTDPSLWHMFRGSGVKSCLGGVTNSLHCAPHTALSASHKYKKHPVPSQSVRLIILALKSPPTRAVLQLLCPPWHIGYQCVF